MSSFTELELEGKAAVIFGADAIGSGIAQRFAKEGARVAVIDCNLGRAQAVAELAGYQANAWAIDLSSTESISSSIQSAAVAMGRLDILVNNVLPVPYVAALELQTDDVFALSLSTVVATHRAMQAALPHLRAAGGGRIINVGHRYGEGVNDGIAAYNSAAWALVGLTRTAAVDWGQYQIVTNLLLPLADTPEFRNFHERRTALLDLMISQLPLARMGDTIEDIGGAALFLAGDAVNFINGQIVYGDGGQHTAGPVVNPGKFR